LKAAALQQKVRSSMTFAIPLESANHAFWTLQALEDCSQIKPDTNKAGLIDAVTCLPSAKRQNRHGDISTWLDLTHHS